MNEQQDGPVEVPEPEPQVIEQQIREILEEVRLLNKAAIIAAQDVKTEDVFVEEWGGKVRLRSISADDALEFVKDLQDSSNQAGSALKIIALCAVDEQGGRLFTLDDVTELRKKSFSAILTLQKAALKLNGMEADFVKTAKNDSGEGD